MTENLLKHLMESLHENSHDKPLMDTLMELKYTLSPKEQRVIDLAVKLQEIQKILDEL